MKMCKSVQDKVRRAPKTNLGVGWKAPGVEGCVIKPNDSWKQAKAWKSEFKSTWERSSCVHLGVHLHWRFFKVWLFHLSTNHSLVACNKHPRLELCVWFVSAVEQPIFLQSSEGFRKDFNTTLTEESLNKSPISSLKILLWRSNCCCLDRELKKHTKDLRAGRLVSHLQQRWRKWVDA